jgi:SAM-dependent methyltransferase
MPQTAIPGPYVHPLHPMVGQQPEAAAFTSANAEPRRGPLAMRFQRALEAIAPFEPRRVLELGCGHGILLSELHDTYPDLTLVGVDRSPAMVEAARRRNAGAVASGRLLVRQFDILRPPVLPLRGEGAAYDLVVSINLSAVSQPETRGADLAWLRLLIRDGGRWLELNEAPSERAVSRHIEGSLRVLAEAGFWGALIVRTGQWSAIEAVPRVG